MIRILTRSMLSLILPALAYASDSANSAGIEIVNAWIAEAPPVSTVNAAYMKIINSTPGEINIASMDCENYGRAEFHRTEHADGMARMHHLDELNIKAGSALVLEPGGYHVMLINPVRALHIGEVTRCTLTLNDGRHFAIELDVKTSPEARTPHRN
jgi:periplasmic copper chaperone A